MDKEFEFFVYLIESYAKYKNTDTFLILKTLDEKGKTDFIYNMYELYHSEAIENAYRDIDSLVQTGHPAW